MSSTLMSSHLSSIVLACHRNLFRIAPNNTSPYGVFSVSLTSVSTFSTCSMNLFGSTSPPYVGNALMIPGICHSFLSSGVILTTSCSSCFVTPTICSSGLPCLEADLVNLSVSRITPCFDHFLDINVSSTLLYLFCSPISVSNNVSIIILFIIGLRLQLKWILFQNKTVVP